MTPETCDAYYELRAFRHLLVSYWLAVIKPSTAADFLESASNLNPIGYSLTVFPYLDDGKVVAEAVAEFSADNDLDDEAFLTDDWQTLFRLRYVIDQRIGGEPS